MSRIKHKAKKNISQSQTLGFLWTNIVLMTAICLLLAYYVASANRLASLNYQIQNLEEDIAGLSEENASLASKRLELDDPNFLNAFARTRGMVQAISPTHVLSSGDVALNR